MKTCLKCGTQNTQNREFCITCGEMLGGGANASQLQKPEKPMAVEELERPRRIWPTFFWLLPILLVYGVCNLFVILYNSSRNDIWRVIYNLCASMVYPITIVIFVLSFAIMFLICVVGRIRYESRKKELIAEEQRYFELLKQYEAAKQEEEEAKAKEAAENSAAQEDISEPVASFGSATESVEDEEEEEEDETAPVVLPSYADLLAVDTAFARGLALEYNQEITLDDLIADFCAYASERGVQISRRTAGMLFGVMGASRLVWIIDKRRDLTQALLESLASYFGTELHLHTAGTRWSSQAGLMVGRDPVTKEKKASGFLTDLYAAHYRENSICISAVDNVDPQLISPYFGSLVEYAHHPERQTNVFVPQILSGRQPRHIQKSTMELPNNLWILLRVADEKTLSKLPEDSMVVDLSDLKDAEKKEVEANNERAVLSYGRFKELMESAKMESYISEEYWKKIDALEEYMGRKLKYILSNRTIQQIEAYAAVCLKETVGVYEVLDAVVAYKMLPELADCEKELLTDESDGLVAALDRIFGLDNMPASLRTVKQMGLV